MRILPVAQKVYPDVKGGGAYHVHAISRNQAAMGHDVTVGDGPTHEERNGYTVVRCPSRGSLLGNDFSSGVGQHLLRADKYDLVHEHSHRYVATNLAVIRRRLGGPPLAITNHGIYSQNTPELGFSVNLKSIGPPPFEGARYQWSSLGGY